MIKRCLLTSLAGIQLITGFSQDLQTQLQKNAVPMRNPATPGQAVYEQLKDFRLILLGEMHGANDPPAFLTGLAELFTNQGDTVQVGFEIPSESMKTYTEHPADSTLHQSGFFANPSGDGRANQTWANVISRLSKNPKIRLFFYDCNTSEDVRDCDSLMYLTIKSSIETHPHWRTITLGGNIHNRRLPCKGRPTMATFLCQDPELNPTDKICTLDHYFLNGALRNDTGNGLEWRMVQGASSVFSEALKDDYYLFLFPVAAAYNGIFFTRTITASELINK